ncbi:MAG: AMP-binding protein, partial [bacterium]|nr:AMP-binding protein [bacterium]
MKQIIPKNIADILALTPTQEGLLYHYLKEPESGHYFEQLSLTINGKIDFKLFKNAWNSVVETNEMLRTRFKWEKAKAPVQIILKRYTVPIVFHDLSTGDVNDKRQQLKKIKDNDRIDGFELNSVPSRITLCKIREGGYEMIVSNHHILYDGWSNGILLKEFFSFYNDFTRQLSPIIPIKTKFKEYINRIQNQNIEDHKNYWRTYLRGFEAGASISIKQKKRGSRTNCITGTIHREVPGVLEDKLDVFTKSRKLTPASLFYSAWGILYQRYSNSEDVLFGTTVSGRSGNIKGIESMVGLFVNTIPLRVRIKDNIHETVEDFLHRVNNQLQERETYQSTSLVEIKESSRFNIDDQLFDTLMVIENYPLEKALQKNKERAAHSLSIDSYSMYESIPYDLTVGITPFNGIGIDFSFNPECFDPQSIERLAGHFMNILEDMIYKPGNRLSQLELLPETEKKQVLYDFNNTAAPYPSDKTIHQLFEEQVERTPDGVAVVDRKGNLTYMELDNQSHWLSKQLNEKGVRIDAIVAIMADRCLEMVIGKLGILKSGGAFLPIDPDYPQERIDFMLRDSGASVSVNWLDGLVVKRLDAPNEGTNEPINDQTNKPTDLAYIIYTSGSTGRPKGVMLHHQGICSLNVLYKEDFKIDKQDRVVQFASSSFDASVSEMVMALLNG